MFDSLPEVIELNINSYLSLCGLRKLGLLKSNILPFITLTDALNVCQCDDNEIWQSCFNKETIMNTFDIYCFPTRLTHLIQITESKKLIKIVQKLIEEIEKEYNFNVNNKSSNNDTCLYNIKRSRLILSRKIMYGIILPLAKCNCKETLDNIKNTKLFQNNNYLSRVCGWMARDNNLIGLKCLTSVGIKPLLHSDDA